MIWIVKRARDEHRQAIEWLNQHTDPEIAFFLVEIELWQIDDSLYAPKFNIVEKPNDWAKTMKAVEGMSETDKLKLEYWQAFVDAMQGNPSYTKNFSFRKPASQHWYTMAVGHSSYHINLIMNTQKRMVGTEIYFSDDKPSFEKYKAKKALFDDAFGCEPEWNEARKDCRIVIRKEHNVKDRSRWQEAFEWYVKQAVVFKELIRKIDE